jgi:hypothetical protein
MKFKLMICSGVNNNAFDLIKEFNPLADGEIPLLMKYFELLYDVCESENNQMLITESDEFRYKVTIEADWLTERQINRIHAKLTELALTEKTKLVDSLLA